MDKFNKKGANSLWGIAIVMIIALFVFGFFAGMLKFPTGTGTQQSVGGGTQQSVNNGLPTVSLRCPSTSIDTRVNAQNKYSATASFLGTALVLTRANPIQDPIFGEKYLKLATGTTNSGGSGTADVTVGVPCTDTVYNEGIKIFGIANGTISSGVGVDQLTKKDLLTFNGGNSVTAQINNALRSNITWNAYFLNSSVANPPVGKDMLAYNETGNFYYEYTLGNGGSITFQLAVSVDTGNAEDGELGSLWVIDTGASGGTLSDNAISLTSGDIALTELPTSECSIKYAKAYSVDSGNRCYTTPAISSKSGTIYIKAKLLADSGNPASVNTTIYKHPLVRGQDIDGNVVANAYDSGGTAFVASQFFIFDIQ